MELKVKLLEWSAGLPVVMINKKTADKIGVHANERIVIKTLSKHPRGLSIIVDIVGRLVKKNEIAISSEVKKRLMLKVGQKVEVAISSAPKSLEFIKKKIDHKSLSRNEISQIIKDIVNNSLSESEIALFVSGMYKKGMTTKETIYLIKAILENGNSLKLRGLTADKHSIGGVPGNRTTPIVVSICTATGLIMPKSSSRAVTSCAGTADVIEAIAPVEFSISKLKKIIKKTNGCMVWGGSLRMVPADSRIIGVEKKLGIDPEAQLLASIISKKLAAGGKQILIDIPYGENAKVNLQTARRLKKKFEYLGRYFNKKMKVVLTKGDQPIGNGIGPVLELIDVINILDPSKKGPRDLEEKSLFLSGVLLEMTGKSKKGKGVELAQKVLDSGKAFKKFKQIIRAQGGEVKNLNPGRFKHNVLARRSGKVSEINNKKIVLIGRAAGCPAEKSAGLKLHFKVGDAVKRNDKLFTIYAESKYRLKEAIKTHKQNKPIVIR